jgi:hypothetical protein
MVDHHWARARALLAFAEIKKGAQIKPAPAKVFTGSRLTRSRQ